MKNLMIMMPLMVAMLPATASAGCTGCGDDYVGTDMYTERVVHVSNFSSLTILFINAFDEATGKAVEMLPGVAINAGTSSETVYVIESGKICDRNLVVIFDDISSLQREATNICEITSIVVTDKTIATLP